MFTNLKIKPNKITNKNKNKTKQNKNKTSKNKAIIKKKHLKPILSIVFIFIISFLFYFYYINFKPILFEIIK